MFQDRDDKNDAIYVTDAAASRAVAEKFQFTDENSWALVCQSYIQLGEPVEFRESFGKWITKIQTDNKRRIREEFAKLTDTLMDHANTVDAWKQNKELNRYQDMLCFDQTRVVLQDGLQPDYINANYMTGFHRKNAYILTQGPLSNTIVDFWRMIWQEEIATIVMATRLEEKGKPKCAKYFPDTNEMAFYAGFFKIRLKKFERRLLCSAALLEVTNRLNQEIRYIVHVWYISWPDQGVPDDIDSLRHFLNYVKVINLNMANSFYDNPNQHKRGPPVLFHCSAGIGRSALLVALDIITEGMIHNHHVNIFDLIVKMRQERFHVVHTKIQLLFVYHYVVRLAAHNRFALLVKG